MLGTAEHENRWETARQRMVARWKGVLERIRSQDEGGALELVNTMDEFCEEAIRSRDAAGEKTGVRCVFCRSFTQHGGCFGLLQEINRAVLHRKWEAARCLAETQIGRLKSAHFSEE
jgi:hypothetical protein